MVRPSAGPADDKDANRGREPSVLLRETDRVSEKKDSPEGRRPRSAGEAHAQTRALAVALAVARQP